MRDNIHRTVFEDEELGACILTEADILAGRDDDCSLHDHEEDDDDHRFNPDWCAKCGGRCMMRGD